MPKTRRQPPRQACPKCRALFHRGRLPAHLSVCQGSPEANRARSLHLQRESAAQRRAGIHVGKGGKHAHSIPSRFAPTQPTPLAPTKPAPTPAIRAAMNGHADVDAALDQFAIAWSVLAETLRTVVAERDAATLRLNRFKAALGDDD